MLKTEMVAKNPLRVLDQSRDGGLEPGQMGLIAAQAGTGKTAFLIQVALDSLFRGSPVLHVSIGETVDHVKAWYEEIFRDLAQGYDLERSKEVWEEAEKSRLILTFRVQAFSVDKLEERLGDLVEQGIFHPRVMLVDGLDLTPALRPTLEALSIFARQKGLKVWAACCKPSEGGSLADRVAELQDLCQVAVGLEPKAESVALTVFKNPSETAGASPITLDTRTLLLVSE